MKTTAKVINNSSNTKLKPNPPETDSNGWPIGFIEETFGSLPDLPEREPQGDYEQREPLET